MRPNYKNPEWGIPMPDHGKTDKTERDAAAIEKPDMWERAEEFCYASLLEAFALAETASLREENDRLRAAAEGVVKAFDEMNQIVINEYGTPLIYGGIFGTALTALREALNPTEKP